MSRPVLTARLAWRVVEYPRHRVTQTEAPVYLPQQRAATVAGDVAAAELDFGTAPFEAWKRQRTLVAFRRGEVALLSDFNTLILAQFPPFLYAPLVESTTGAVVGRHDPIYTHSVSSRRSANRTWDFPHPALSGIMPSPRRVARWRGRAREAQQCVGRSSG